MRRSSTCASSSMGRGSPSPNWVPYTCFRPSAVATRSARKARFLPLASPDFTAFSMRTRHSFWKAMSRSACWTRSQAANAPSSPTRLLPGQPCAFTISFMRAVCCASAASTFAQPSGVDLFGGRTWRRFAWSSCTMARLGAEGRFRERLQERLLVPPHGGNRIGPPGIVPQGGEVGLVGEVLGVAQAARRGQPEQPEGLVPVPGQGGAAGGGLVPVGLPESVPRERGGGRVEPRARRPVLAVVGGLAIRGGVVSARRGGDDEQHGNRETRPHAHLRRGSLAGLHRECHLPRLDAMRLEPERRGGSRCTSWFHRG